MSRPPGSANVFDPVRTELDFPRDESEDPRVLESARHLREDAPRRDARDRPEPRAPSSSTRARRPPTACPHNGHVLTRAVKDLFPRYKTMRGYDVPRKAGWDTHGLPVEVEVEKELRIHGKAAIEKYGVEPFIAHCIESVFRYTEAWESLTDTIGFWVDLPTRTSPTTRATSRACGGRSPSSTRRASSTRATRSCWWWAQGGTALSAAEVGWNYKTVDDPSVYVAFPLVDEPDTALRRLDDDAVDLAVEHVRGGEVRRSTTSSSTAGDREARSSPRRSREELAKKLEARSPDRARR